MRANKIHPINDSEGVGVKVRVYRSAEMAVEFKVSVTKMQCDGAEFSGFARFSWQ